MERNNNIYINLDGETFSISIPFPPSRFHHRGVTLLSLLPRQITVVSFRFDRENGGQQPDRKLKHACTLFVQRVQKRRKASNSPSVPLNLSDNSNYKVGELKRGITVIYLFDRFFHEFSFN